ncbi:MAG TPA: hypothetical protein DC047_16445 [Blastocatellia bacterium]|nr:hypothetical protein [Blastocatellia bacterium]
MVTFLITSFFILAVAAIAVYFWQKPAAPTAVDVLPPPPGRGLFSDGTTEGRALALADAKEQADAAAARQRAELLERAGNGDKSTLLDALNLGDKQLYEEALNLLVAGADSDPGLLSLVSFVTRHELRVNQNLAASLIASYARAPDRNATAKTLHIAALSDDAVVYQSAVEVALQFWRAGRLVDVSALELRSILDGEFWILSSATKSSGAGFLLKRTLANARRELEAASE